MYTWVVQAGSRPSGVSIIITMIRVPNFDAATNDTHINSIWYASLSFPLFGHHFLYFGLKIPLERSSPSKRT